MKSYDDPMARRRRAEELAREKHPNPHFVGRNDEFAIYEIPSDRDPMLIYTIEVDRTDRVIRHAPPCKAYELFGVCSHAAAAWLAEHEHWARQCAEDMGVLEAKRLHQDYIDSFVQLPLWPQKK